MTVTTARALRGTVTAAAYFLDPQLIGVDEAQRRVLAQWQEGCRLLRALDGWLLVLAHPAVARTALAPGQPIAPQAVAGTVRIARFGTEHVLRLEDLAPVDMSQWLARGSLHEHRLTVCDGPVPASDVVAAPAVEAPDLRVVAGVSGTAPRADQVLGAPPSPARRRLVAIGALVLLLALIAVVVALLHGDGTSGGHERASSVATTAPTPEPTVTTVVLGGRTAELPLPDIPTVAIPTPSHTDPGAAFGHVLPYALLVVVLIWIWRPLRRGWRQGRAQRAPTGPAAGRARTRNGWLARLVPGARGVVGRRQARYLNDLTDRFGQGDWDGALRRAIRLSGAGGGGAMSLRLPKPRQHLAFGAQASRGGTFYGENVYLHLRGLYRAAAQDLEEKGRAAEAAFVHGELLQDTLAAVAVLERAGMTRTAAELATARDLDPALLVRLWWRAGDRERAVDVARSRGAFAAGIERLEKVDATAARALRAAWVASARAAGDLAQALEAAWPDAELRVLVGRFALDTTDDLDALRPAVLARVVVSTGDAAAVDAADRLLLSADAHARQARDAFVAALAGLDGAVDEAQDRRLCSEALLSTLRDGGTPAPLNAKQSRRLVSALSGRADPLLVADLPSVPRRRTAVVDGVPELTIDAPPGSVLASDVAVLPDRRMLLAMGTRGSVLLSPGGAVAQRWDRPAERIVLADNAASALLMHTTGVRVEVSRLDVATLRTTRVGTITARHVPDSYDGGILVVVDDRGIALLDVLSPSPRELWRELSAGETVMAMSRTPDSLAALVRTAGGEWQLCRWSLPDMIMRLRNRVQLGDRTTDVAVVPNHLWSIDQASPLGARLRRSSYWKPAETDRTSVGDGAVLGSSGALAALCEPHPDDTTSVTVLDAEVASADAPGVALTAECSDADGIGMRSTGDLIIVWAGGSVVAYDRSTSEVVASTAFKG